MKGELTRMCQTRHPVISFAHIKIFKKILMVPSALQRSELRNLDQIKFFRNLLLCIIQDITNMNKQSQNYRTQVSSKSRKSQDLMSFLLMRRDCDKNKTKQSKKQCLGILNSERTVKGKGTEKCQLRWDFLYIYMATVPSCTLEEFLKKSKCDMNLNTHTSTPSRLFQNNHDTNFQYQPCFSQLLPILSTYLERRGETRC